MLTCLLQLEHKLTEQCCNNIVDMFMLRAGLSLWVVRARDHIFWGHFSNSNRSYKWQYNKIKTLNHWCSPMNPLYMREEGKITNSLYTNLKCLSAVCEMKRAPRGNRNVRQYWQLHFVQQSGETSLLKHVTQINNTINYLDI